ncbi:hypothetical protein P7K49_013865 [Saguinus oedipus]|uniref:Uncharacterized protein n=1 Tax=Saguinus oedipus TaxID=9490 RepID=A0ABQ9VHM8_SAGOE|nr:hypothetical protein P7K49_013865 [Saguinus oedipus]
MILVDADDSSKESSTFNLMDRGLKFTSQLEGKAGAVLTLLQPENLSPQQVCRAALGLANNDLIDREEAIGSTLVGASEGGDPSGKSPCQTGSPSVPGQRNSAKATTATISPPAPSFSLPHDTSDPDKTARICLGGEPLRPLGPHGQARRHRCSRSPLFPLGTTLGRQQFPIDDGDYTASVAFVPTYPPPYSRPRLRPQIDALSPGVAQLAEAFTADSLPADWLQATPIPRSAKERRD